VDVIADLGRVDRSSPVLALAQASDWMLPVAAASLPSVQHLRHGLAEVASVVAAEGVLRMLPLLIGREASGEQECAELDALLAERMPVLETAMPIPVDAKALLRLEAGEPGDGRLGRTVLLRRARMVAHRLVPAPVPPPPTPVVGGEQA
jgi:hypothetical protein